MARDIRREEEYATGLASDSDTSTVSMGDDKSNASSYFEATHIDTKSGSFLISELDDSDLASSTPIYDGKSSSARTQEEQKVNVLDIFNKFKPSKVRSYEEETVIHEENPATTPPQNIEEEPKPLPQHTVKSGITAKEILTGIRPSKQKRKEDVEEAIKIPSDDENILYETKEKVKSGVTAKDILTGKQKNKNPPTPPDVEMIEVLSSNEESTPQKKLKKKKKSKKSKSSDKTLIVKLKYKSRRDRIADLESKIRNSMASSVSAKDLFKRLNKKKEMLVTLNLTPEKLKQVENVDASFFTKGTSKIPGAKSYLDMLSYKPVTAKNPIYKLKEISTPAPTSEQFHVTYDAEPIQHRSISLKKKQEVIDIEDIDYSSFDKRHGGDVYHNRNRNTLMFVQDYDLVSIAQQRVVNVETDPRFSRFMDLLEHPEKPQNPSNDLWTSFFKPQATKEILFDSRKTKAMKQWLENSFQILKKKTKRPNFKKFKKGDDDEFDDFIVEEFDEETEDEAYVPIMILNGPEGIGKSSAIYSLVEELSGYVYEINASQARGRKDIMTTLKELSTTQLVHQSQDMKGNEFQKGVILFEDVDVLFESDRGFWSVMEHVLTISRRPIILTCTDLSVIPSHILECAMNEKSLHEIPRQPLGILSQYLFLMALTKKVQIVEQVLNELIIDNSFDLRKCVLTLQVFCEIDNPNGDLIHIGTQEKVTTRSVVDDLDLKSLVDDIDAYSMCDLFETSSKSLINHEYVENEVVSNNTYINEEELRATPLPFEFRPEREIQETLPKYPYSSFNNDIESIKKLDKFFFKSRLKENKRITRHSAMSMFDFDENLDSKNIFTLPTSTYTTDISPFFRVFSRAEVRTDHYNRTMIQERGKSVEELLREGFLIKKKFSAPSDMLLYGPLRYWNV